MSKTYRNYGNKQTSECCGKCKYHKSYDINGTSEWYCDNQDSYNNGIETDYTDTCEDFEER